MTMDKIKYKRVLLKLTGELFGEKDGKGINFSSFESIAKQIISIHKKTSIELVIVVGGGNIFRGRERINYMRPKGRSFNPSVAYFPCFLGCTF